MSYETAFEVGRLFLPLKTIADAINPVERDPFIHLPALRGYWPMSTVTRLGDAVDHSNVSTNLLPVGSPLFNFDGNAYIQLGVGNDYLITTTPDFSITGTEAWIASSLRGLTIGGWFWVDTSSGLDRGLITKDVVSPNRGYLLYWDSIDRPGFFASGDGTAGVGVLAPVQALNEWHFLVGRFTPGGEVAVFVNGNKTANTTSIPAAINVSTQNFEVGRYYNDNNRIIEGRARDVFICAAALSDETLSDLYQATRPA